MLVFSAMVNIIYVMSWLQEKKNIYLQLFYTANLMSNNASK